MVNAYPTVTEQDSKRYSTPVPPMRSHLGNDYHRAPLKPVRDHPPENLYPAAVVTSYLFPFHCLTGEVAASDESGAQKRPSTTVGGLNKQVPYICSYPRS